MGLNLFSLICLIFLNCTFYQFLYVPHSRSSTQSWGSVLPSIVETRDQNSQGCPLLFSNRNLGSFCTWGTEILYTHSLWEVVDHSRSKMHETCLIIIHDPGMRPGPIYGKELGLWWFAIEQPWLPGKPLMTNSNGTWLSKGLLKWPHGSLVNQSC